MVVLQIYARQARNSQGRTGLGRATQSSRAAMHRPVTVRARARDIHLALTLPGCLFDSLWALGGTECIYYLFVFTPFLK